MIDIDALLAERDALKAELDKLRPEMLTALGQCTEEHVWEGHPKMVALRAENERMKTVIGCVEQLFRVWTDPLMDEDEVSELRHAWWNLHRAALNPADAAIADAKKGGG